MSEGTTTTDTTTVTTHPAKILRDSVLETVEKAGPQVRERVKNTLVEAELSKRADMILKGLNKRDEAQKAINKIKPDQIAYDADGKKTSETYSKAKVDELNKAKQQLASIDKALEEALSDTPNFDKLAKAVGGGGGGGEKKEGEEKSE